MPEKEEPNINQEISDDSYVFIPMVEGEDLEIYDPIYTDLFHIAT